MSAITVPYLRTYKVRGYSVSLKYACDYLLAIHRKIPRIPSIYFNFIKVFSEGCFNTNEEKVLRALAIEPFQSPHLELMGGLLSGGLLEKYFLNAVIDTAQKYNLKSLPSTEIAGYFFEELSRQGTPDFPCEKDSSKAGELGSAAEKSVELLSRLLVVDDWSSDPREAGLLDDTDIGTTVMQELFYLVDELTDFVNNFGSYKAFASPEEPVKNKIVSLIREAHLDLVKTVWLFGKTRAMLASILELPEFERLEAVVHGQNPVKWLKKVISTIDILSQGRTRASHNFQPASNFGKKSKRFSKMGEIERQNYNMEVLETVYPDNFRSYKHKISSLRAAVLEKKKKQKFEDGYKLFLNLLDEIPEAIPETRETTFFDLDMVKEFRGGWFSRFEKALSAFDYNSRETLAARSGEIKSALENNLKAVARRELTGFYDYQKWLTCLCRQRIDVSLESREIDAVNREIRRDKVAREKEAFLNSLDNPDFVDRLFDNPIYLKGVISDCLREGIPFELVRVKKAVLAKFADDFSTLVNLEYLQKLDEVAKVLGFVSSRDEEVTEFLEKSDDPILRSLASKQLATPEASTQQPNKVSDNADAFADFVATSIMKYFYSNNLFTPEIQSKFAVASFWLGLRNNVSIAYRSLRLD